MAEVSVKFVDWVLRHLPELRKAADEILPNSGGGLVVLGRSGKWRPGSAVERVAVRRAAVLAVVDAAERALRALHPEQRKIYRLKYRVGLRHREIARRLYLSQRTVERRVEEVREAVMQAVGRVAEEDVRELRKFLDKLSA
ncbi:MAG: hypothetical protein H5U02_00370 [Clostridia bacterium]|nr:hypothetical protein [Clostridia bacterium]